MIRFCNPLLLTQCGALPGPDIDEMIDFVLAGLGHRAPAA